MRFLLLTIIISYLQLTLAVDDLMNGVHLVAFGPGCYSTQQARISIQELSETNANWMGLLITWSQANINSTKIVPTSATPNETDVIVAIQTAHALGLKIAIKPQVDLFADEYHWRGEIGTFFNSSDWAVWFQSYSTFILYYTLLSEQNDADLLIIGTELSTTESHEDEWKSLINEIRKRYSGQITYGTNHGCELGVKWWDAVDYIGIDAYYPLASENDPPISELDSSWDEIAVELANLSTIFERPILFTEIGYESMDCTAITPWSCNGTLDLNAQANCYEAFFQSIYSEEWFAGVFWWAWSTFLDDGGPHNMGFTPRNKPAETILKKYFT